MFLVLGLGATGLSCVRHLTKQKKRVMVADTRKNPPNLFLFQKEFPDVPIFLGPFSDAVFEKAETIVMSPGVSLHEPCIQTALKKNIPVVGDIELFATAARAPIVAITGSNGKTTVTTLMGKFIQDAGFRAVVCGNIGLPVLDALQEATPDYYVVELSSFQLQTTFSLRAKTAVVINVSPDHLDRHKDEAEYIDAKKRVYLNCDNAIVNADEKFIWENLNFSKPPIEFTLEKPTKNQWGLLHDNNQTYLAHGDKKLIATSALLLQERHNLQNFLVCLAIGETLQLPIQKMLDTIKNFSGLAHRCQLIKSQDGVRWYNDSKATNVGAAIAAIDSISRINKGRLILIAGGDSKGVDLTPMQIPVKQSVFQTFVLGKDANLLEKALKDCTSVTRVNTLKEAVLAAKNMVQTGDIVLLSPACASLDQYSSYVARGNDFVNAVENAYG